MQMQAFFTHHLETWRDPWLADTRAHPWYFGIVFWEYLVQMPFFFVASYAYYKGNDDGEVFYFRFEIIEEISYPVIQFDNRNFF